jgi:hypothetical protein
VVCTATCFHPDLATQLNPFEQFLDPITTDQLAPADRLFRVVYAVQLKDILCQIESNADKLHGGLLLSKPVLWKLQFDTNVPSGGGGVHPIALGRKRPVEGAKERAGCVKLHCCYPEVCGN